MYYLYLILCADNSLYTGITTNVDRRFAEHAHGTGAHYTRARKAVRVVYREKVGTRSAALKREAEIKRWPKKKKLSLCTI